jgi:hypothetical protein
LITALNAVSLGPDELANLFSLPLSQVAFQQMQSIQQVMNGTTLSDNPDKWSYYWGSDNFASTRFYKHLIGHHPLIHPYVK